MGRKRGEGNTWGTSWRTYKEHDWNHTLELERTTSRRENHWEPSWGTHVGTPNGNMMMENKNIGRTIGNNSMEKTWGTKRTT
jgi:hypothetical protein